MVYKVARSLRPNWPLRSILYVLEKIGEYEEKHDKALLVRGKGNKYFINNEFELTGPHFNSLYMMIREPLPNIKLLKVLESRKKGRNIQSILVTLNAEARKIVGLYKQKRLDEARIRLLLVLIRNIPQFRALLRLLLSNPALLRQYSVNEIKQFIKADLEHEGYFDLWTLTTEFLPEQADLQEIIECMKTQEGKTSLNELVKALNLPNSAKASVQERLEKLVSVRIIKKEEGVIFNRNTFKLFKEWLIQAGLLTLRKELNLNKLKKDIPSIRLLLSIEKKIEAGWSDFISILLSRYHTLLSKHPYFKDEIPTKWLKETVCKSLGIKNFQFMAAIDLLIAANPDLIEWKVAPPHYIGWQGEATKAKVSIRRRNLLKPEEKFPA